VNVTQTFSTQEKTRSLAVAGNMRDAVGVQVKDCRPKATKVAQALPYKT